jgi:hypothetical protein
MGFVFDNLSVVTGLLAGDGDGKITALTFPFIETTKTCSDMFNWNREKCR